MKPDRRFTPLLVLTLCGLLSCRITNLPLWQPGDPAPDALAVKVVRDVPYYEGADADDFRHRLDLFLPTGVKDFPVVVLVHGGFWTHGDNNCCGLYSSVGEFLASQGIAAVLPNYRLSPEVKHPEHVKDVARALAWTRSHIAAHGGDPEQLFVAGHSAGGHLAALVATDETYLKAEGMCSANLKGVIGISGPYRIPAGPLEVTIGGTTPEAFRFEEVVPLRHQPTLWAPLASLAGIPLKANVFGVAFGDDPKARKAASPIHHVRPGLPPFLLIHAEKDFPTLARMAEDFHQALLKQGNDAELLCVVNRNHNSVMFRAMEADDPVAAAMVAFVRRQGATPAPPQE